MVVLLLGRSGRIYLKIGYALYVEQRRMSLN
jgi:hypothetical protein